jgi:hypothetical protein
MKLPLPILTLPRLCRVISVELNYLHTFQGFTMEITKNLTIFAVEANLTLLSKANKIQAEQARQLLYRSIEGLDQKTLASRIIDRLA